MAKKGTKEAAAKILLKKGWSVEQVFDVLELGKVQYHYIPTIFERPVPTPPYTPYWTTTSNGTSGYTINGAQPLVTSDYAEVVS